MSPPPPRKEQGTEEQCMSWDHDAMEVTINCDVCAANFCSRNLSLKDRLRPDVKRHLYMKEKNADAKVLLSEIDSAREDQMLLRDTLLKNGATVVKRWRNPGTSKAGPKRQQWIQRAEAAAAVSGAIPHSLPFLERQYLAKDMVLIKLLHYRAAHSIEEWAQFDDEQCALQPPSEQDLFFCSDTVCMAEHNYGAVTPFHESVVEKIHGFARLGWLKALRAFRAQRHIYGVLRHLVDIILDGSDGQDSAKTPVMPLAETVSAIGVQHDTSNSIWTNFAISAPPKFTIATMIDIRNRLEGLIAAQRDHLRFLQTDPAYLRDSLTTHTRELQTIKSRPMREISDIAWAACGCRLLELSSFDIANLTMLIEQVDYLSAKCKDQPSEDQLDGHSVAAAMAGLFSVSCHLFKQYQLRLRATLAISSGYFKKRCLPDGNFEYSIPDSKSEYKGHELLWLLVRIAYVDVHDIMRVSNYLALLDQQLCHAPPQQREDIPSTVYAMLGTLSILQEINYATLFYRPRPVLSKTKIDLAPLVQDMRKNPPKMSELEKHYLQHASLDSLGLKDIALKLKDFYFNGDWPVGKRTEQWLEQAQKSRQLMQDFWNSARSVFKAQRQSSGYDRNRLETELADLSFDLTPEYDCEMEHEKEIVLRRSQSVKQFDLALQQSEAGLQTMWDAGDEKRFKVEQRRIKLKTRKSPDDRQDTSPEALRAEDQLLHETPMDSEVYEVGPKSLKVLHGMLRSDVEGGIPAVKWVKFQAAMGEIGFACYAGSGSAVTFRDTRSANGRSIVFHRPHPKDSWDPIISRRCGIRLEKNFGWHEATFVSRKE